MKLKTTKKSFLNQRNKITFQLNNNNINNEGNQNNIKYKNQKNKYKISEDKGHFNNSLLIGLKDDININIEEYFIAEVDDIKKLCQYFRDKLKSNYLKYIYN